MSAPSEQDQTAEATFELGFPNLNIPPDIEQGLKKTLNDLQHLTEDSNPIHTLRSIKDYLKLIEAANDSQINLTSDGIAQLQGILRESVAMRSTEVVDRYIKKLEVSIQHGYLTFVDFNKSNLGEFITLAHSLGVTVTLPLEESPPTSTPDQAVLDHTTHHKLDLLVDQIVQDNIVSGICYRLNSFGTSVASGSDFGYGSPRQTLTEIQTLVHIAMTKYGITPTTEDVLEPFVDNSTAAHKMHVINPAEIPQIADNLLRANLAKGAAQTMVNYGRNITYEYACRSELRDYYTAECTRLDLIDTTQDTLVRGDKFNPNLWEEAISEQVKTNLPLEVAKLPDNLRDTIRDGRGSISKTTEEYKIDKFKILAQRHKLDFDADAALKSLSTAITADNARAGLSALTDKIISALHDSQPQEAAMRAGFSVGFLDFIRHHGLEDELASELAAYHKLLQSNGLSLETRRYLVSGSQVVRSSPNSA